MNSANTPTLGNLAVLGSTGSVGTQALDVVRRNAEKFRVLALAAGRNVELLLEQVREFRPKYVALCDQSAEPHLRQALQREIAARELELSFGASAVEKIASLPEVHTVVSAIAGFAGMYSSLAAIKAGKHVAQANKELIVAAGPLLRDILRQSPSAFVPVDSEHNSLFQSLASRGLANTHLVRRMILTASGGPFLHFSREQMASVTPEQAVRHPNWSMGAKISIDSATLMNKGLEVIEAAYLFSLEPRQIEVLVHPQSVVHGLVEYGDGSSIGALYEPSMQVPIAHALDYLYSPDPKNHPGLRGLNSGASFLDLAQRRSLEFFPPDFARFPALGLAYQALELGGTAPAVLNAANEVAVEAFCQGEISFLQIAEICAFCLKQITPQAPRTLKEIEESDALGREIASKAISSKSFLNCCNP